MIETHTILIEDFEAAKEKTGTLCSSICASCVLSIALQRITGNKELTTSYCGSNVYVYPESHSNKRLVISNNRLVNLMQSFDSMHHTDVKNQLPFTFEADLTFNEENLCFG